MGGHCNRAVAGAGGVFGGAGRVRARGAAGRWAAAPGGAPSGSAGDLQLNNSGAFGTATDIQSGASININSGSLELTGGIGLSVANGPLSVTAGSGGNILLRSNGNVQIDSNGSNITIGNAFNSNVTLGGTGSNMAFYGGTRQPQPTITGSRSGNAALPAFLTAFAACGLLVDSTTP